ncbi:hypothetical protein RhiirA1_477727 [Rhizophagus irregularis]|uniref:Uncharacterized protein n=1 Tax=Rhizophagus irregularis TaxID=588596 RepID=A0A2N0QT57_9GLOM|nr:hypothetical protein RhiirA1_477727 [Rhizophagus irregularis]
MLYATLDEESELFDKYQKYLINTLIIYITKIFQLFCSYDKLFKAKSSDFIDLAKIRL